MLRYLEERKLLSTALTELRNRNNKNQRIVCVVVQRFFVTFSVIR